MCEKSAYPTKPSRLTKKWSSLAICSGRPKGPLIDQKAFIEQSRLGRAIRTLDTSELPPVQATRVAGEAAILLNEVLDKVKLPPYEAIPDAATMRELPAGEPRRWQVPGTEITIERVEEGPRKGEYLFSSDTVGRVHEFYDRARNLPYRPGAVENLYLRLIEEQREALSSTLDFPPTGSIEYKALEQSEVEKDKS